MSPVEKPPKGYYRSLLPKGKEHMRMADLTSSQPCVGVTFMSVEETEKMAAHFDTLSDPHAAYYADLLRSGKSALILPWPPTGGGKTWAPGELFLRS